MSFDLKVYFFEVKTIAINLLKSTTAFDFEKIDF